MKKISGNYHLPYFTISPTFSICPIHGYLAGEHEYCPKCDQETEILEKEGEEIKNEIVANESAESSIVVSEDSVEVVESKVEREILVPMRSKLNLGGEGDGENKM